MYIGALYRQKHSLFYINVIVGVSAPQISRFTPNQLSQSSFPTQQELSRSQAGPSRRHMTPSSRWRRQQATLCSPRVGTFTSAFLVFRVTYNTETHSYMRKGIFLQYTALCSVERAQGEWVREWLPTPLSATPRYGNRWPCTLFQVVASAYPCGVWLHPTLHQEPHTRWTRKGPQARPAPN